MYAIFNADGDIQEVAIRGYQFACIFRSQAEAEKALVNFINSETYEIRKVKVF